MKKYDKLFKKLDEVNKLAEKISKNKKEEDLKEFSEKLEKLSDELFNTFKKDKFLKRLAVLFLISLMVKTLKDPKIVQKVFKEEGKWWTELEKIRTRISYLERLNIKQVK